MSQTSRGLRSVLVQSGISPASASLSAETVTVERDWNRYDLDLDLGQD
jgi:hypothetical protein